MENKLTYTQMGDYLFPNVALPEQPDRDLGKYGRMRLRYLKEHRPVLWGTWRSRTRPTAVWRA